MNQPEATVIIPTRNRWRRLWMALGGALHQEDVDVEIIVIDEGSSDETPERLAALNDRRVRVFQHEEARGVAQARNRGIAEARGEWIAFLDDDDVWSPHKLRTVLDVASPRRACFTYSGAVHLDDGMRTVWVDPAPDPDRFPDRILESNVVPSGCSNVVCRTDLVRGWGASTKISFTSPTGTCGSGSPRLGQRPPPRSFSLVTSATRATC